MKARHVEIQSRTPTPGGRFRVIVDSGRGLTMEKWTIEEIKRAVALGVRLTEREVA